MVWLGKTDSGIDQIFQGEESNGSQAGFDIKVDCEGRCCGSGEGQSGERREVVVWLRVLAEVKGRLKGAGYPLE